MSSKGRIHIIDIEPLSASWNKLEKISFQYMRADGETQPLTREIYHVDDGATVLLYDNQRRTVILVRQFRLPAYLRGTPGYLLETPAGFLDGADPEARMKQEAEEETGYRIASMQKVFEALMVPGCVTHAVHCFIAAYTPQDKISDGGGLVSEGEDIEVVELSIDDALAMIGCGDITDGKTIMLLQYAALNLLQG
jgi:nudix-type nucleoside diphosphatase (YffH/AdpP family)